VKENNWSGGPSEMVMLYFLPPDGEHPSRTVVTCTLHDSCNVPANKVATALGVVGSWFCIDPAIVAQKQMTS
jgi:hypothetical protein